MAQIAGKERATNGNSQTDKLHQNDGKPSVTGNQAGI